MFTAITQFTVPEDRKAIFEEHFTASMQSTLTDVPGLQRAQLLRPSDGENYLAVLEFDDKDAFGAYVSSEAFHSAHDGSRPSHADDHQMSTYTSVAQIPN